MINYKPVLKKYANFIAYSKICIPNHITRNEEIYFNEGSEGYCDQNRFVVVMIATSYNIVADITGM